MIRTSDDVLNALENETRQETTFNYTLETQLRLEGFQWRLTVKQFFTPDFAIDSYSIDISSSFSLVVVVVVAVVVVSPPPSPFWW